MNGTGIPGVWFSGCILRLGAGVEDRGSVEVGPSRRQMAYTLGRNGAGHIKFAIRNTRSTKVLAVGYRCAVDQRNCLSCSICTQIRLYLRQSTHLELLTTSSEILMILFTDSSNVEV